MDKSNTFFYLNISSQLYYFTEFHNLLASTDVKFGVIGITQSKLNRNKKHLATIDLPNYNIEHCPADGANRGALFYIKEGIIYKLRIDLKIFKSKKLESIFIEIINPKHKNVKKPSPLDVTTIAQYH